MTTKFIINKGFSKTVTIFLVLATFITSQAGLNHLSGVASAAGREQNRVETTAVATVPLIISEFRLSGPAGANDEFIEIYNNSDAPFTVSGGGSGYGLAASDGILRMTIPNGTSIAARGHYLGTNSGGYSLTAGAAGDVNWAVNISDQAGIALFNTNLVANFDLAHRIDAVGPISEANPVYREGNGLPSLTVFNISDSWARKQNNGCDGLPKDTNDNAADFLFVDTNGTSAGGGQRLGAPGPQDLLSPKGAYTGGNGLTVGLVDKGMGRGAGANFVRDLTSVPANNSTFGAIDVRRKFTNTAGTSLSYLRFRITDLSTFPSPAGIADLRANTSTDMSAAISAAGGGGTVTVHGTNLAQTPNQPNGGGFNSAFNAAAVTPAAPLNVNQSIDLRFVFGIQQTGSYRFAITVETYPVSDRNVTWIVQGHTETSNLFEPCSLKARRSDFDGDGKSDVSVFRSATGSWYQLNSSNGAFAATQFGLAGDVIVPGDYDADGKTDLAVWRPSNSVWYVQRSATGFTFFQFGLATDLPAQGDFDGDGRTDFAVFRPSTGVWYLQQSTAGFAQVQFGLNGDKPVVGDYDGDGKADIAVFRPSTGTWYLLRSTAGFTQIQFGLGTDKVAPADYDGDGKTDVAVFRDSNGTWYQNLSTIGFNSVQFGTAGDIPAPGDFDFDGKADVGVFRPANGTWYRLGSSNNAFQGIQFGQNGDQPVSAGYVPVQ
jgi:hypothetical protein